MEPRFHRIGALTRRRGDNRALSPLCDDTAGRQPSFCKPNRELSPEPDLAVTVMLDVQLPEL